VAQDNLTHSSFFHDIKEFVDTPIAVIVREASCPTSDAPPSGQTMAPLTPTLSPWDEGEYA